MDHTRLPRATGEDSQTSQAGALQAGLGDRGVPRPQREEWSIRWGSPPRGRPSPAAEGVREGRVPVPRAMEGPGPVARPPARHTRHPPTPGLGGACDGCSARAPQNRPPHCRERQTRATPARPRGPRPAEPQRQLGPQRPPCHLLQASGSAAPKRSPCRVSQLRGKGA